MQKVLIVTYYWPPSGGAGVQRWLKLTKYLCKLGLEVHVLTVDPKYASYVQLDMSMLDEVHEDVRVHRTYSFEVIRLYGKIAGRKNVPTAGFANVDNASFVQKAVTSLRSNLFIPDPRKGWNGYAIRAARQLISSYDIKTVITSSPPHSTQLIGKALKRETGVKWIADMRDPWTDIYYYELLGHSSLSRSIDRRLERSVLKNADHIFTVSQGLKDIFLSKHLGLTDGDVSIIPNGFDPDDFPQSKERKERDEFLISYTGTMSEHYAPEVFFDAVAAINAGKPAKPIRLRLIGSLAQSIRDHVVHLGIPFESIATVPHSEVTGYQQDSDALLLVIPQADRPEGIVTGKIFEYLATGNPIIGIGPPHGDAAAILSECKAGRMFDRASQDALQKFILDLVTQDIGPDTIQPDQNVISKYSREQQAAEIAKTLESV